MRGCACGFENESAVTLPAHILGGVNYRRLGVAEQPVPPSGQISRIYGGEHTDATIQDYAQYW
jgi:hypothetical protein